MFNTAMKYMLSIGYSPVELDDLDKQTVRDGIIRYYDSLWHNEKKLEQPLWGDIGVMHMNKIPGAAFTPFLEDTNFDIITAYIGDDLRSTEYGRCRIIAVTDGQLYEICFSIKQCGTSSASANHIQSITHKLAFMNDEGDILIKDKEGTPYGFGACWIPSPTVKTYEQKNLYNLQKSLKKWSVENKFNTAFRNIERRAANKSLVAARRERGL